MSRLVLIIARSGTGKSSSMRNLKKGEANVILCSGKELPFKSDLATMVPHGYGDVIAAIEGATAPIVVIDDLGYMLTFEEMARQSEVGYQKFTQMAANMFRVFKTIIDKPSNQTFYLMAHAADTEDGTLKFKTTGKLLSEKIVLEGLTNIVVSTDVIDEKFVFKVKTDGTGIKTPIGMFNTPTIPNDLKELNKTIVSYYGM